MSDSNNFTPSELIYSFLDGEASATQRSAMFAAMANDNALQEELHDALRIRTAALRGTQSPVPSPALTQRVFAKAGFDAPGAQPESAAPTAVPLPWFTGLNRFLVPVLSAAGGAIATAILMLAFYPFNQGTSNVIPAQPSVVAQAPQITQPAVAPVNASPIAHTTAIGRSHASSNNVNNLSISGEPKMPSANEQVASTTPSGIHVQPLTNNDGETTELVKTPVATITPLAIQPPSAQYIGNENEVTIYENPMSRFNNETPDREGKFMLTLSGMTGVQLYPSRSWESGWNIPVNDFSIGGMYYVSNNQALGLVAGEEMFPMYLNNANTGTYSLQPTLFWIGAAYRYSLNPISILGVEGFQPFGQVVAAGTQVGPIGKVTLGLSYQINSRFMMSAGVDGSLLGYRIANGWAGAEKLGVSYSCGVNF